METAADESAWRPNEMLPQPLLRVSGLGFWLISNARQCCELSPGTPQSALLDLQPWKPDPQRGSNNVSGARVVAPNKKAQNNGLERTRSASLPLGGPRRSTQCSAYTQVRDERTRSSGRMSDHHAKVEGPESRPNLARVVGVAGQSTWVAGRISGLPVARPSTQVQWQPACREAPCPRSWCGSRSGRGFTTARLSAWAKGGRSASDASPHHLVRSAGMASGSTDTLKASRLLQ